MVQSSIIAALSWRAAKHIRFSNSPVNITITWGGIFAAYNCSKEHNPADCLEARGCGSCGRRVPSRWERHHYVDGKRPNPSRRLGRSKFSGGWRTANRHGRSAKFSKSLKELSTNTCRPRFENSAPPIAPTRSRSRYATVSSSYEGCATEVCLFGHRHMSQYVDTASCARKHMVRFRT